MRDRIGVSSKSTLTSPTLVFSNLVGLDCGVGMSIINTVNDIKDEH
jgi:hypothetical protein